MGARLVGDRHIHHFVPGFVLGFAAGGIASRRDGVERWLAVPFGAGAALVFDEASLALGIRLMRRGEELVLPHADS